MNIPARLIRILAITALAALPILASPAARAEDAPEGFAPLFNGKDLQGWTGDPALWSVSEGTIAGSTKTTKIKRNTFLATEKKYGDFVLKAKVKLINGNSGIQFRSQAHPDYVVKGYQADVAEKDYFGMLYEEGGRGIMDYWKQLTPEQQKEINAAAKMGEWNEYEIACKGHHVTMVLNGKTVLDLEDPAGAAEGVIALQLHVGPGMEVFFKDLFIKELK